MTRMRTFEQILTEIPNRAAASRAACIPHRGRGDKASPDTRAASLVPAPPEEGEDAKRATPRPPERALPHVLDGPARVAQLALERRQIASSRYARRSAAAASG